jgi:hypothetical protein
MHYREWQRRIFPPLVIAGRPAIFSGQESQRLFSSHQAGAEKHRLGNFATRHAQKSERHGIQGGRLTTLFSEEFEQGFSIIYFFA